MNKKMNFRCIFIIVSLVFLAFGCKRDSNQIVFDKEEILLDEFSSIPIDGLPINVDQMEIFEGDKLIIRNFGSNSLFDIYDLNNLSDRESFGVKGQGPDDFVTPIFINQKNDSITIFDFGVNKIFRIDSLRHKKQILKNVQIEESPLSIKYLSADKSVMLDSQDRNELTLRTYDSLGKMNLLYSFPDINKMNLSINLKDGYWDLPSTKDGKIIYAYQYLPRFDIISQEGKLLKSFTYKDREMPKGKENIDYANTVVYNFKVITFPDKFYIYRIDKKGKDLVEDSKNSVYIDCYSNEGELMKTYKIKHFIKDFVIWNNQLIAVNYPEQDSFLIFDLK